MCVQGPALIDTLQHQKNTAFAFERKNFLHVAMGAAAVFLQNRMASAADGKAQRIESVQPPSPGVSLDMIITMKMAKNLRELSAKVDAEDWGAVSSFLTSPWSSGTARFVRKNQVKLPHAQPPIMTLFPSLSLVRPPSALLCSARSQPSIPSTCRRRSRNPPGPPAGLPRPEPDHPP